MGRRKPRRSAGRRGGPPGVGGLEAFKEGEVWRVYPKGRDFYVEVVRRPDGGFDVIVPLEGRSTKTYFPEVVDLPVGVLERLRRGWLLGRADYDSRSGTLDMYSDEFWQICAFLALFPGEVVLSLTGAVLGETGVSLRWRVQARREGLSGYPEGGQKTREALAELEAARKGGGDPLVLAALWLSVGGIDEDGSLEFEVGGGKVRFEGAEAVELAKRMVEAMRGEAPQYYRYLGIFTVKRLAYLERLARTGKI